MEEYKSLYEYLGKKAGKEMGKIVYQTARLDKVLVKQQEVSNPLYTGKVMTYPVTWLDSYFDRVKEINNNKTPFQP
jgi:hypothetical protein